jgi:hypothetical protein
LYKWAGSFSSYENIKEATIASEWIAPMHTVVPHGGKFGFGGNCLPKDLIAFYNELEKIGMSKTIIFNVFMVFLYYGKYSQDLPFEK